MTGRADSDSSVLCLLPGYHLEDTLKDFLLVINKRCDWASQKHLSPSLPPSLLPPGQATLILQAAQAVVTHVSQVEVLAANSQHIIGLNVLIPEVSFGGFALAESDDLNKYNHYTNISRANFKLLLQGRI